VLDEALNLLSFDSAQVGAYAGVYAGACMWLACRAAAAAWAVAGAADCYLCFLKHPGKYCLLLT
jgi:uncharacterized RDD family membrane protein YckC